MTERRTSSSVPVRASGAQERQIEMRQSYPIWGRLGVGAEAWAELQSRAKENAQNKSSVYLTSRTFQTVMNALRHCGEKHYVDPSVSADSPAVRASGEPQK